eukprot:TRINITY_DN34356_c0_g1_i1.p1 TRINITY_DN34356_c0_g1~~TRINITY_DN34356_c0_g1_i1.p1  ORF type:complete len:277 (+),score=26.69 TRINITY_DN34356_c0_g1_i1:114-833(+)
MSRVTIINANKPFSHLSKFIFIDQMSTTDDGNTFQAGSAKALSDSVGASSNSLVAPVPQNKVVENRGVLDALGTASPDNWYWQPNGFYDNNPGSWSRWNRAEMLSYDQLSSRIPVAAQLNAQHQRATDYSVREMQEHRNSENCFRVVELGIPAGAEVTVLAKPRVGSGARTIVLCPPPQTSTIDEEKFQFRILQGHTVENLVTHRKASLQVYFGFAVMGMITVYVGEEAIRDGVSITYG